jgi:ABC-type sugar transport system ATPase subunit
MSPNQLVPPFPSSPTPLIRVSGLAKAFGPTQALRDASFELRAGEIHALLGENGSGKSTLVKILSGVHSPDAGLIELSGREITALRTPKDAQRRGVMTVFQEVLAAESRSVLENVWLGADGLVRSHSSRREQRVRAGEVFVQLLGAPLDLDAPVEELSLSDRQACSIVRALLRRPDVLILDEATSALDFATRDRLFEIVREMCNRGAGVIFITHRLDEISAIGDRLTVLRSGTTVATLEQMSWTTADLIRLMTGDEGVTQQEGRRRVAAAEPGQTALSVTGLRLGEGRRPIDIVIRPGELVGVAGLEGQGQDAFLDALRGRRGLGGKVIVGDAQHPVVARSIAHAARNGIAYVPRERRQALFGWMSIRENFGLPTLSRDSILGWLQPAKTRVRLAEYVERMGIVLRNQDDRITTLSGGNQQKIVIARWLAARPRVLLLNDPTRGIDFGAKRDLYALLLQLAAEGIAIIMLSTELDEHLELMDRVLVFREQELFCEIARDGLSRQALVSAFFGEDHGEAKSNR